MAAQTSHVGRKYDVFLSFRGQDTRKNFTDYLYHDLIDAGINAFRDDEGLQRGEHISIQLKQAIQSSRMSIVVFSRNYASSRWCLEELAEIMKCRKSADPMVVVPVFYDVEPSVVRHQKRTFEEAFVKHEQRCAEQTDVVATWRAILTEAADLSGYHLKRDANGFERELIKKIVKDLKKLKEEGLFVASHEHKNQELPLLIPELIGEAFITNKEEIWSKLMDDRVLRIGIYGMGGVGKTTLMRHIQNQLLTEWSSSNQHVYWVTVSRDSNIVNQDSVLSSIQISKLQNHIAKEIGLDLAHDEDEWERATKLTKVLEGKGKSVLILDDLWNHFDLLSVGIPVSNKCKLVLTTRSLNVCRRMQCKENIIKVQPLSDEEAWNLFTKELESTHNSEVEQLAKYVAKECSGLPLGIRTMARSMRGVDDVCEWRNALEELKGSKVTRRDMDEEVLCVLKLSYLRLNDPTLQKCFLYCALFPEDENIIRDQLIQFLIAEEIIDENKSIAAKFDNGHSMLNKLRNVCLLEDSIDFQVFRCVKMHDLIRDMAIQELRESSTMRTLVEAGIQLKELPDVKNWTENLVIVSLMKNDIVEIPSDHIPMCPNLKTLLLRENRLLRRIPNSFFEQIHNLRILDFSRCVKIEELPDSISDLENLAALLLCGCYGLMQVPSLTKLTGLKMLDLRGCSRVTKLPEGLEMLYNLKYLDLTNTGIKEMLKGLLQKLYRLQVLKKTAVEGREVGMLRKLEALECGFKHPSDFNQYMNSREQQSLSKYYFVIGDSPRNSIMHDLMREESKGVRLTGCCRAGKGHDPMVLPNDIEVLSINGCHVLKSFSHYALKNLKSIEIIGCHGVKKLFPPILLPNLQHLKNIKVHFCLQMEEIFARDEGDEEAEEEGENNSSSQSSFFLPSISFNLPKLRKLKLLNLPKLRSIYNGAVICHSLEVLHLRGCLKLKRIQFSLPLPSLRSIKVFPEEWWESLEWNNHNAKNYFQSLVEYPYWSPVEEENGKASSYHCRPLLYI